MSAHVQSRADRTRAATARLGAGALTALAAVAWAGCSGSAAPPRTTRTTVAFHPRPAACTRMAALNLPPVGSGRVRLDTSRSTSVVTGGGPAATECFFSDSSGTDVADVTLRPYASAAAAVRSAQQDRASDAGLGLPVQSETYGQYAFSAQGSGSWSCEVVSGALVTSASVRGDGPTACAWAESAATVA